MRLLVVPLLSLALAMPACAGDEAGSLPADRPVEAEATTSDWREYASRLRATEPVARFVEATALFLGTPYSGGPLGEGEAGGPDPDPRCDFSRVDCVTYLEQSLALALADPTREETFLETLDAIRYREGRVGFPERNHYMVLDWVPANAWLLADVTAQVGGEGTRRVRRTIDRAEFLREQGAEPRAGLDEAREIEVDIVPIEAAAAVASTLRSGDLVFWVGRKEGIFVLHTGLVVREEGGPLRFRHGSSKDGVVQDDSFVDYAAGAVFAEGFLVLRLREAPAAATGRDH